ncbi:MAG: replication protein [Chloroflexi bacterium]|nr:replication protein [Chloroflexota bacterium]OJV89213.1 MAG: hypothetical protein BGO39_35020 [Chloroflexi bacterium 54-19]
MKQWPSDKKEYVPDNTVGGELTFSGFKNLNSTPIPDEFFDVLAVQLSEAELRVLLYIMRRTFGFKKKADAISLSQLTGGIRKRDGSVLDHGTGLSKPAVLKAVSGLQARGIITIEKRTGEDGRNEINVYQLRFADEPTTPSQPTFSSQQSNSSVDYSTIGHNQYLSPDPRFVSARPVAPVAARSTNPGFSPGFSGEQRQTGDFNRTHPENFGGETEITPGVNQLYREGKPTLPGSKSRPQGGKQALPGVVNQINRGSQIEPGKGVNQVYRQHESQQDSSKQTTETQTVWRASGSLAYQPLLLDEPVEPPRAAEELYINLEELAGEMYGLGLSQKVVLDYIQAYPAEYLWEKVRLTHQQLQGHQPTVKNTAGYLRRAITEDYRSQPSRTSKNARTNPTGFAERFQGTLAYLNRNRQPGTEWPGQEYFDYSSEEENYSEEAATLSPIYRQDYDVPTEFGESSSPILPGTSTVGRGKDSHAGSAEFKGGGNSQSRSGDFLSAEEVATGLWEKIYEDLEGRFRLGQSLELLRGALFFLPGPDDCENFVTLQLSSPWQERTLGMAARSAITLAVRQRLGPGFKVNFCSA